MKKTNKNGFTLVELLAVIVILAIILVIAVPKVMSVIEDSKKATLESTAKMIAGSAEKVKVQNTILGKTDEITCDSVAKINDIDYETCEVEFVDNTAKVSIKGSGKFAGLYVCSGDKTTATATDESCPIPYGDGDTYITNLLTKENELHNGLVQTTVEYEGKQYNAGIRYVGPSTGDGAVNNQVYFNCEETDGTNTYGTENYDYSNSCEIWRMIGVFEVEDENGDIAQRIKLINTNSKFKASWDSSDSTINNGEGINQWGENKDENGTITYSGADLMQLLNGYYIGAPNSECKYNTEKGQSGFSQTCTVKQLTNVKMKPLTSNALSMITKAVWDTYSVKSKVAAAAYLEEKGISAQYTGISSCSSCNDGVIRTTSWTGLVGLMTVSDITYANGWLYNSTIYPWAISTRSNSNNASGAWGSTSTSVGGTTTYLFYGVWPSVYLDKDVQIIGGNGGNEPYKLAM